MTMSSKLRAAITLLLATAATPSSSARSPSGFRTTPAFSFDVEPWRRRTGPSPPRAFASLAHRRRGRPAATAIKPTVPSSPPPASSSTALHLLKGLDPTVDDDINREMREAQLKPYEIFRQELDGGANIFAAIAAVRKRGKDKAGGYENKYKILADYRSYGNRELLDKDHVGDAPTLDDLNQLQPNASKVAWVTGPYRFAVFVGAFFAFPYFCELLGKLVNITADEFDIINDQFTPGIGILYGTFVALTLDILYERQGKVQENASVEASLLSQVTQNVLSLFRDNFDVAREATQIVADQVRIIVYRSRGAEMLNIMRSDPYARLLSIVDRYQRDGDSFTPHEEALIDGLRSEIPALMEARAKRLSDEASALPPAHYLVLLVLTILSLIGFTAATLTISDDTGKPPLESRLVFAALTAVYVLFFNFCKDMNDPYDGVYQIKRSSAASYLLQIKWLIANQPFGADIRFDTRGLKPVYDGKETSDVEEETMDSGTMPLFTESRSESAVVTTSTTVDSSMVDKEVVTTASASVPVASKAASTVLAPVEKEAVATASVEVPAASKVAAPEESPVKKAEQVQPSPKAEIAKGNASAPAKPEPQSAASFLPKRVAKDNSKEEMQSQFESLSGFSGEKTSGGGVTVPSTKQNPVVDKQKISMYFRKTGGFGG